MNRECQTVPLSMGDVGTGWWVRVKEKPDRHRLIIGLDPMGFWTNGLLSSDVTERATWRYAMRECEWSVNRKTWQPFSKEAKNTIKYE